MAKITLFAQIIKKLSKEIVKSLSKKAWYGQICQGFQHLEPSGKHDILPVRRLCVAS